jgi:glycosyltransferase involved in cell wall biosynthesis
VSPIDLSIVIPALDEAARLPATLADLARFLCSQPLRWELVLSDDGSTDGTAAAVRGLPPDVPARVVRSIVNRGKGHAVRAGMLAARGRVRVMCDADGSMPAAELPKLIEPLERGRGEVAIGSRYLDGCGATGQPAWRRAWSRAVNALVCRKLVPGICDTQCGYKAFTDAAARQVFGRAVIDGWAFDLEVLALAQRLGQRVLEVAIDWKDDRRSRVRGLRDLPCVTGDALRIRSNLARGAYRLAEVCP